MKNYYRILGIPYYSTVQEISEAYQNLKKVYRDQTLALYSLIDSDEAQDSLKDVEQAYQILSDPQNRKVFDLQLKSFEPSDQATWIRPMQEGQKEASQNKRFNFEKGNKYSETAHVNKAASINKYSLIYDKNPQMEEEIKISENFEGQFLKKIREYKNINLERMAEVTRISKRNIINIEQEDYKELPAAVYIRGYVSQIAKFLKLDDQKVASSYMARYKAATSEN